MAAYAALRTLTTILDNIQIHPRVSTLFDKQHIQSLHQIINFLLHFMETRGTCHAQEDEALERQIASTTHKVEDVIESHLVNQILADERQKNNFEASNLITRFASLVINYARSISGCFLDLETQIQDMNALKETVMQFQGTVNVKEDSVSPAPLSKPLTTSNNNFVIGFEERVIQIMERLTGHQSGLQIVPIVGMGGIGKTTLAKCVYDNFNIVKSFDIRAWITVSQDYSLNNLLSQLLSCIKDTNLNKSIGVFDFETDLDSEDHQLGLKLYQTLWGRRYLIVLDDMWSIEAWYRIKNYFPNSAERSRVVITTRISSVATHLSSSSFEMNFLDDDQSWKLFCGNVFLEKGCPPELEHIGKEIVRECKGLPLSIVVIGGLLRNSKSTREYWENFARDLNSILISGNYGHCLNILSLSYNHLPTHLKPCFLYMGIFKEDEKILVSRLINLLVAEGFLKPKEGLTMEEAATDYLNDLVDRNLILADGWKWDGRIRYCKMHDLVRGLCLKIGEREKIFQRMSGDEFPAEINGVRGIVFRGDGIPLECPSASLVRTFLSELNDVLALEFRMLRVLSLDSSKSPEVIFQHVNLRYLACDSRIENLKLPSSVSLLWNVHTLIFPYSQMKAPSEIWCMRQLRHIHSYRLYLPDPPTPLSEEEDELALLPNLHTLKRVVNLSFTEQVCKRIFPNIKKLRIVYTDKCEKKCYFNLEHLRRLQSLYCYFEVVPGRDDFVESLRLPSSLRKLCLYNCGVDWEDVNRIGGWLPHLQFLKLYYVKGEEWDCVEGAFPSLKVLEIFGYCDLIKWSVEISGCFPVLQKLELYRLEKLERIPSEIQTLGSLHVEYCSVSAAISGVEILEEQLSFGNHHFHLLIEFDDDDEKESFMEEVDINSFTPNNFKLF